MPPRKERLDGVGEGAKVRQGKATWRRRVIAPAVGVFARYSRSIVIGPGVKFMEREPISQFVKFPEESSAARRKPIACCALRPGGDLFSLILFMVIGLERRVEREIEFRSI